MKIVVDFSENEIAFDDDNEVCEAVHQADLDRDGNHLAEATKLTPEKATGTKVGSLEGRKTQNTKHPAQFDTKEEVKKKGSR